MSKEDIAYQEWVRDIEGKLPDEVKTAFQTVTAHDAGREVFRANLRRQDYDRRVGEVESERRRLKEWFETEASKNPQLIAQNTELAKKLEGYERTLEEFGLKEEVSSPRGGAMAPSVARKDDVEEIRKEFDQKIRALDMALPALLGDLATVVQRSTKEGYNIDPRDVISYAAENRVNPLQAFDALTAVERGTREVAKQKQLEEKWKEEGRREALSRLPSPTYIRPAGPTVVDNLNDKNFASDSRTRVNEAVKDFLENGYGKGSGSAF